MWFKFEPRVKCLTCLTSFRLVFLQIGAIFSASFCGQAGYLLACGGAMGSVTVWDMRSLKAATNRWPELKQMGLHPEVLVGGGAEST